MTPELVAELKRLVAPGYVHAAPSEIISYSYDGTFQQRRPDLAVSPASTEEVANVMRVLARAKIPVIARGASSGLAGGTIPESGGVVLNLARMDRVVEIDNQNVCVVAQAGVVTLQLQQAVERAGLFYPPVRQLAPIDHRRQCGDQRRWTAVFEVRRDPGLRDRADGGPRQRRDQWLGGKVTKNATGYQLIHLLIGSEGTLGIVTEVILKLVPLPGRASRRWRFSTTSDQASRSVSTIMGSGILPPPPCSSWTGRRSTSSKTACTWPAAQCPGAAAVGAGRW